MHMCIHTQVRMHLRIHAHTSYKHTHKRNKHAHKRYKHAHKRYKHAHKAPAVKVIFKPNIITTVNPLQVTNRPLNYVMVKNYL